MDDWNGTTSIERDLLNRITKVTDHEGRTVEYGWDNVGNKTVQGYPDGTQADYYYDAENQITEVVDPDGGITKYAYDANGNKTFKEYPNYETAYYFYDACDQVTEMDEYNLNGKKLYKTTYSWDAEGNLLSEMQYNHGQSGSTESTGNSGNNGNGNGNSGNNGNGNGNNGNNGNGNGNSTTTALAAAEASALAAVLESVEAVVGSPETELPELFVPEALTEALEGQTVTAADLIIPEAAGAETPAAEAPEVETPAPEVETPDPAAETEGTDLPEASEAETPEPEVPEAETPSVTDGTGEETGDTETEDDNRNPEGFEWGNGNGEVPPGQTVDEDGNIVNGGGNMPPGLNRGEKPDKDDNPNPPDVPENPGTEDSSDKSANKANKGTHIYTYDELNRMATSDIAKEKTTYTYDTLGNLVSEKVKNKTTDYQYNELNQLIYRKDSQNQQYTYTYDKRGNRVAETGKKESQAYVYDETNRLVEGTNWKGDKSSYTYNGVGVRINNTQTSHSGSVYSRDYVTDYTSLERDDLMVYAAGDGQLDYVQREVYAGSERIEQYTDRTNGGYERLLYVHEDLQGNTRYYTKENGQSFAELTYDAWGMPESPNKLLNNDHGNYVYATYTGHIFDTTLDIYFAEFRFYDAATRQWLAMDPIKDGENWYQYCYSNPLRYWDPLGLLPTAGVYQSGGFSIYGCNLGNLRAGISADLGNASVETVYGALSYVIKSSNVSGEYTADEWRIINYYRDNFVKIYYYEEGSGDETRFELTQEQMSVNAQYIYEDLSAAGWTINAISGILGNMQHESYLNPATWQSGRIGEESAGYGLVQLTESTKLINWAKERGLESKNIDTQLAKLRYDVWQPSSVGEWVGAPSFRMSFEDFTKSTEEPEYLAEVFMRNYERPKVEALDERMEYAREWYDYFTGQ